MMPNELMDLIKVSTSANITERKQPDIMHFFNERAQDLRKGPVQDIKHKSYQASKSSCQFAENSKTEKYAPRVHNQGNPD